jgi:F-type H+-transporting ATPase subunit b
MHIDWWTLALQTVNVLILIWLLARFFFRPIADIVAKRQKETNKLFAEADAARQQAAAARAQADKDRAEVAAEHDRLLADAQKSAQAEKAKLMEVAAQDAAKLRHEAEAAIARDRVAAEKMIVDHAAALSVDIAHRLLERLPAKRAFEVFLAGLCVEIGELAPEARAAFAAAATTARPVEVVTQQVLSDEEKGHVRDALKQALGAEPSLTFRDDATVLAGIELRGHNVVLRNSWRADLERIREELSRERHPSES